MQLSENTLSILKNFSGINPSIMFKKGNIIRTISPSKTVMAQATIADTIDGNAAVYDLSRFLSTLSLFDGADVEFGADKFIITGNRRRVSYTYAAENMIVSAPDKEITLPSIDVTVNVTWEVFQNVIRAAGVLQVSDITFVGEAGKIRLKATDTKNPTSDAYDVEVDDFDGKDFNMHIKVDNLKLIPADYTISLSSKGMAHFKSDTVQYWIAVQTN